MCFAFIVEVSSSFCAVILNPEVKFRLFER